MANKFFTADTHFGHKYMLTLGLRKYPDVQAMDEAIIANWNALVMPRDDVFILGDMSFRNGAETLAIVQRLNGRLHLVLGNHDHLNLAVRSEFEWVKDYHVVRTETPQSDRIQRIVLGHYALRSWENMHYGAWNLHGHSHGTLPGQGKQLDVGIDNAFKWTGVHRPFSLKEVEFLLKDKPIVSEDFHQPK